MFHNVNFISLSVKNNWFDLVTQLIKSECGHYLSSNPATMDLTEHILLAIREKNYKMLNHLIMNGANITKVYRGLSPLVLAAHLEDERLCCMLINSGANVNHCARSIGVSQTPLSIAIKGGLDKAVRMLLLLGADPNNILDWSTASSENIQGVFGTIVPARSSILHMAVAKNNLSIVRALVKSGASVMQQNSVGDTCLHQVIRGTQDYSNLQIAKFLINTITDNDSKEMNGNVNAQNSLGQTPLVLAISIKHIELAQLLIESGVDLNIVDNNKYSVLHYAVLEESEEVLLAAIRAGAVLNDVENLSPLHLAVIKNKDWAVDILQEEGADPFLCSPKGETILHLAVTSKSLSMVERCLTYGLPVNAKTDKGDTALMLAARQEGLHICEAIISAGAYLNERDKNKETALCLSVYFGLEENAKLLIAEGADLNLGDSQ